MEVFGELIGQASAKRVLEAGIASGKLPQALVFAGPIGVGRATAARLLSEYLHGSAKQGLADTFWFTERLEDKRERGVTNLIKATTDEMVHFLQLSPLVSKYKVAIVERAGELSGEAQNALLKTLEEPRADSVIVLIVESDTQLLPTIVSRAKVVRFGLLTEDEVRAGLGEGVSDEIMLLAQGSLGRGRELLANPELFAQVQEAHRFWSGITTMSVPQKLGWSEKMRERDRAVWFLEEGIRCMRNQMLDDPSGRKAVRVDELVTTLQRVRDNANVRLALDAALLAL